MTLTEQINEDLKLSMKKQDKGALRALRAIKSALLLLQTESTNKVITKQDEIAILQRLVKQRKESIEIYRVQGRNDLEEEEQEELFVIENYLPSQMTLQEIEAQVKSIIDDLQATSMKDMGKVMQAALKQFEGKADGKAVSQIVKNILQ